jgi:hypothetical protein
MSTSTRAARTQIRQGDVLLTPIPQPQRRKRAVDANGRPLAGVRVEGERTGHAHELAGRVYEVGKKRVVFLERPTEITHQEHRHIEVPAGWWEVRTQREFVPIRRTSRRRFD